MSSNNNAAITVRRPTTAKGEKLNKIACLPKTGVKPRKAAANTPARTPAFLFCIIA